MGRGTVALHHMPIRMSPPGELSNKAQMLEENLETINHQSDAIHTRSRRLEFCLEELYEQNEKLKAELQWTRDERDQALRGKAAAEANVTSLRKLFENEQSAH